MKRAKSSSYLNGLDQCRDCLTCVRRQDSAFAKLTKEQVVVLERSKVTNVYEKGQVIFISERFGPVPGLPHLRSPAGQRVRQADQGAGGRAGTVQGDQRL